jgi:probable F420-dependent oxidoreductase
LVLANDFRHPVVLAKEAASLDVLSGGRFEFGLGTGYARADHDQTGIPLDPPGVRVARVAEAVGIIKAAFSGGPVEIAGEHYTVRGFELRPKPVQRPRPPLLIGGGSRRILALAAREADIVGLNVRTTPEGHFDLPSTTPEATAQKVAWVREAAGERFAALELHALAPFVAVTDEPEPAVAAMLADWGLTALWGVELVLASPHALIGTEDQIVGKLLDRRERYGISYVTVCAPAMEAFAPVVARLAGR